MLFVIEQRVFMVHVELIFVDADQIPFHSTLSLKLGATVLDALTDAKVYQIHPETKNLPVGIYAKLVTLDTVLKDGDRIEIYRPLTIDPKEKRRRLARLKKHKK
jgi:putative ubiquitin-RnfH superfamily antitoxin RatB of RatAB toxin-antitoxin module